MAGRIIIGTRGSNSRVTTKSESAAEVGSGLLDVWSTPSMVAFMEKTSMELVAAFLEEGEGTVGTRIEADHIAASPIGREVTCTATITETDGRKVVFSVVVEEGPKLLGRAIHTRYIINESRFMAKLSEG